MTAYQELIDALSQVSKAVAGTVDPAAKDRYGAQQAALARLQSVLDAGSLAGLSPAQAESAADEVRALLQSNGLNLKWSRLRARLARIGAPRVEPPAPRVARLDLVS